jgi:hypothetical protein
LVAVGIVAVVAVFATVVVIRWPASKATVTISFVRGCSNPTGLTAGGRNWESTALAPKAWGSQEPGTLTLRGRSAGTFRSEADGRTILFHDLHGKFGNLTCRIGQRP